MEKQDIKDNQECLTTFLKSIQPDEEVETEYTDFEEVADKSIFTDWRIQFALGINIGFYVLSFYMRWMMIEYNESLFPFYWMLGSSVLISTLIFKEVNQ